jgi:hypothetical protein
MTALLVAAFFTAGAQAQDAGSSLHLQYAFHKGDQYQMKQHSQEDTYINLNGEQQRTTNDRDATLLLTVSAVAAGKATLRASYTHITMNSSSADQQVSVNTDGDSDDVYNRLFKAMTGKNFYITLQNNGTIAGITGLDSIIAGMVAAAPEVKAADRPILKSFLESQLGSEALQAGLAYVLPYYPSHEVQSQGSWSNLLYTGGFYHGRIDNYWKLDYGSKYSIKLSNKGRFVTDSTELVDLGGGQKGYVNLKGEITGSYLVDPETYWPTMCITHLELRGDYIYVVKKRKKERRVPVPVRVVMDASYHFKHL